jgi:heme-degrading monooxygenase HmoA
MHVRITMATVTPDRLDDLISFVRDEVAPVERQRGARGLTMDVDRETGGCAFVSFWNGLDELRASDPELAELLDRAAERFGTRSALEAMEVAEMRIVGELGVGRWNRVSVLDVAESDMDTAIEAFRSTLPALEAMTGFRGASLAVHREAGHARAVTTWEDEAALRATDDRATTLREEVRDRAHGTITDVLRREVVLLERM